MAALIALSPDVDWETSGGLFDWTLEFLIGRLTDRAAADRLQEIVDNNLGSLWLSEFPLATQQEIVSFLRTDLIPTAVRELPDSDRSDEALDQLRELVELTYQS